MADVTNYEGLGLLTDENGNKTQVTYRLTHSPAAGFDDIRGTIAGVSEGIELHPGHRFTLELQDGKTLIVMSQTGNQVIGLGLSRK